MSEKRVALLELIEKIERLGQFQDRIDFPSSIKEIWNAFLNDVRNLIEPGYAESPSDKKLSSVVTVYVKP